MIKKQPYTAPEAETLVVRFEAPLLDASISTDSVNSGYDNDYDLGTI